MPRPGPSHQSPPRRPSEPGLIVAMLAMAILVGIGLLLGSERFRDFFPERSETDRQSSGEERSEADVERRPVSPEGRPSREDRVQLLDAEERPLGNQFVGRGIQGGWTRSDGRVALPPRRILALPEPAETTDPLWHGWQEQSRRVGLVRLPEAPVRLRIAGAASTRLRLRPAAGGEIRLSTDETGRLRVRLPIGPCRVLAQLESEVRDLGSFDVSRNMAPVLLPLRRPDRGRIVTGRVVDLEGEPVSGARVIVRLAGDLWSDEPGPILARPTTDAGGRWKAADLRAGTLDLTIRKENLAPSQFPGLALPEDKDGRDGPVDLGRFQVRPSARAGLFVEPPVAECRFALETDTGDVAPFEPVSRQTEEGRYLLSGFPPGEWRILVGHPDFAVARSARQHFTADETVELRLRLPKGGALAVRVLGRRRLPDAHARIRLLPLDGPANPFGRFGPFPVNADGEATIEKLASGPYRVRVEAPGHLPIETRLEIEEGRLKRRTMRLLPR